MATILATFSADETSMRYQEPFLTQGLNKKLAINTPPGIYRGFRLSTSVGALTVTVTPDSTNSDHVAVYQTQTGFSLTLRRTGGSFALNLSAFASKTVVVCVFATYAVGSITSAEIRGYEVAPSDTFTSATENPELIVLGTVVVPASGTISAASITHDRRRPAWANTAPEASPWSPLLRNSGFEHGVTGSSLRYAVADWVNRSDLAVNGNFVLGTSTVCTGAKSLEFGKSSLSDSVGRIEQYQEVPVAPGQLVRVSAYVRQLVAPTGSYTVNIYWGDANSTATSSTAITVSTTGVDASFRLVEQTFAVPAAVFTLKTVTIEVVNVSAASTGTAVAFDDVQVYLETGSALAPKGEQNQHLRSQHASSVQLEDPSTYAVGQLASLLRFDKSSPASEGRLILERRDQDYSGANLPPVLEVFGRAFFGSQLLTTEAKALLARVTAPIATASGIGFTLLWESVPSGLKGLRIYGGDLDNATVTEPGFLLTVNARFDGTNWVKDVNATVSAALYISSASSAIRLLTQTTPDTWASGAWLVAAAVSALGDFSINRLNAADLLVDDTVIVNGQSLVITPKVATHSVGQWTSAVHGLLQNDGPFNLITTGVLPTGFALSTNYWTIVSNNSNFGLASSLTNAIAGSQIVGSGGSGTHSLISIARTLRVSNSTVVANATVLATGNIKTGGRYLHPPVARKVIMHGPTVGAASRASDYTVINIPVGNSLIVQIHPTSGKTIRRVRASGFDSATGPTMFRVQLAKNEAWNFFNFPTPVGSVNGVDFNSGLDIDPFLTATSNGSGDFQVISSTLSFANVNPFGSTSYYLIVDTVGGSATCRVQDLEFDEEEN